MQWEYNLINLTGRASTDCDFLDSLGSDGWELVSVSDGVAYFKRPKTN